MEKKLITVKELASIISVSAFTIRKLARERKMPCCHFGKKYLFDPEEVIRFIKEKELPSNGLKPKLSLTQADNPFPMDGTKRR